MNDTVKPLLPYLTDSPEQSGEPCPYCGSFTFEGVDEHAILPQSFRMVPGKDYDAYRHEIGEYHYITCANPECEQTIWLNTKSPQGYYPMHSINHILDAIAMLPSDKLSIDDFTRLSRLLKSHGSSRLNPEAR